MLVKKPSSVSNPFIEHYINHATRDLVTRNFFAGSSVDGRVLSLHEGVRKYLNRNRK
jgi:hypothetical protein